MRIASALPQTPDEVFTGQVTPGSFWQMPEDYRNAVLNILIIHAVSELSGADYFRPSIEWAPTPLAKRNMAQVLAQEYGHHLRFARLCEELGVPWDSAGKGALTLFDTKINSWAEQIAFLAIVDRAARLQFEDFAQASYLPLAAAARKSLAEENFHAEWGRAELRAFGADPARRDEAQAAVDKWYPLAQAFFGRSGSARSAQYRRWGLKQRGNDEMRAAWAAELAPIIRDEWRLVVPRADEDTFVEYAG